MIEIFLFFIFCVSLTYISNKKSFLPNYKGDIHQKFFDNKKVPLVGGLLTLIAILNIYYDKNLLICITFTLIFLVGFLYDIKILSSPKQRLIIQFILILSFSFLFEIEVTPTRIEFFDLLLENYFFSMLFTIFCLVILVNGSNFIDGLNGLLLGYFILILIILNFNNLIQFSDLYKQDINFIIYSLIIVFILNLLNYLYLGDGGSNLLGLFIGYILISIYNLKPSISPYYIILLLWYPCFEILFSIIRKLRSNVSITSPDNKHFHQLFYLFLKSKLNLNKNGINNLTSILINSYNLLIFYIGSTKIYETKFLIMLILLNILIYTLIFFLLYKNFNLKKN